MDYYHEIVISCRGIADGKIRKDFKEVEIFLSSRLIEIMI